MNIETIEDIVLATEHIEDILISVVYKRIKFGIKDAKRELRQKAFDLEKKIASSFDNEKASLKKIQKNELRISDMLQKSSIKLFNMYIFTTKNYKFKIDKRKSKANYINTAKAEYMLIEAKMIKKYGDEKSFKYSFENLNSHLLLAKLNYLIHVEHTRKKRLLSSV